MIEIAARTLAFGVLFTAVLSGGAFAAEPPPAAQAKPAVPVADAPPPTLGELLKQIEAAYRQKNYPLGLSLVKKAYELKTNDVSAMDRIGSVYYVLGRYGEALTVWSQALPLERNKTRRRALQNSILVTRRTLGLSDGPAGAEPAKPPRAAAPKAAAEAPAAPPAPPAPMKAPELSPETKAQIQRVYKSGVKFYASGQYLQATTAFLRVLELDPGNADATKALQRLKLAQ